MFFSVLMFTATLTLVLQDINDNFPTFDDKNYTFSVSENAVDNSIITTIRATDKDVNRTISYDLIQGQYPTSSFKIGRTNGRYQYYLSMVSVLPKLIFWCLHSSLAGWAEKKTIRWLLLLLIKDHLYSPMILQAVLLDF